MPVNHIELKEISSSCRLHAQQGITSLATGIWCDMACAKCKPQKPSLTFWNFCVMWDDNSKAVLTLEGPILLMHVKGRSVLWFSWQGGQALPTRRWQLFFFLDGDGNPQFSWCPWHPQGKVLKCETSGSERCTIHLLAVAVWEITTAPLKKRHFNKGKNNFSPRREEVPWGKQSSSLLCDAVWISGSSRQNL